MATKFKRKLTDSQKAFRKNRKLEVRRLANMLHTMRGGNRDEQIKSLRQEAREMLRATLWRKPGAPE